MMPVNDLLTGMTMDLKPGRWILLFTMMVFFAILAIDISVPAIVLALMAVSRRLVLESERDSVWKGRTA